MGSTKVFQLLTYFEDFESNPSFMSKRMFGGMAVYLNGLNVAVLAESPGETENNGIKYNFDIWDGVLIPTSKEHHQSLQSEITEIVPHPILGKWLYLPQQTENFEESLQNLMKLMWRRDSRIGIMPGQANSKKKIKTQKKAKKKTDLAKKAPSVIVKNKRKLKLNQKTSEKKSTSVKTKSNLVIKSKSRSKSINKKLKAVDKTAEKSNSRARALSKSNGLIKAKSKKQGVVKLKRGVKIKK